MHLVEIKVSSAMLIVVIGKFHNSVVIKEELIQRGIYSTLTIFFASLFHHGGFTNSSCTLNHD